MDENKPPVDYRNYNDDRPERRHNVTAFISGMVPGIFIIIIFGCLNFEPIGQRAAAPSHQRLAMIFGGVAVVGAMIGMFTLRGPHRRFMLGGFFLGIALTCLLEGVCFLSSQS